MATKAQIATAVDIPFAAATAAGKARRKRGDFAVAAAYESQSRRLRVELASGVAILVPVEQVQGLGKVKAAKLDAVELSGAGYGLRWADLDLDVSVPDLIAGVFGTRAWMTALGRHAGKKRSRVKAEAARRNGRKGGRPRKLTKTRHADAVAA